MEESALAKKPLLAEILATSASPITLDSLQAATLEYAVFGSYGTLSQNLKPIIQKAQLLPVHLWQLHNMHLRLYIHDSANGDKIVASHHYQIMKIVFLEIIHKHDFLRQPVE